MRLLPAFLVAAALLFASAASAQTVAVQGGATSVLLDLATLEAAAGLTLAGATPEVEAGILGAGSVAFPITAPPATDFSYDPADFLGTFAGTGIEHTGSVIFDTTPDIGQIQVGNFTIGFDAGRQVSLDPNEPSGFFVQSNGGFAGTDGVILFDIGGPTTLNPGEFALEIGANLLVSPEFAQVLDGAGLATIPVNDLTGADVGDAFVNASIPEPSAALLAAAGAAGLAARRRGR